MAERPEDSRRPRPIVPDPDASLAGHHRPHASPRAAIWPLWLLILLLVAALIGLAAAGWLERQRLEQRLVQLNGEISNVHARFDASEGRGDVLSDLQARLDELEGQGEAMDARLKTWRAERLTPLADTQAELQARLATLAEDGEVRADTLAAVRDSMDALETASREGQAALTERLAALETAHQGQAERREALASRLDEATQTLSTLDTDVEALATARDDDHQQTADLEERLGDMQAELRELRQSQLAINARLEALRQ
jgi:chromosome segregation ATPase